MTKKQILEILLKAECGLSGTDLTGHERILRIPEEKWQAIKAEAKKCKIRSNFE
jgi:hypothetical protein